MTHVYFSARTEGRISYGHLGRTSLLNYRLHHCQSFRVWRDGLKTLRCEWSSSEKVNVLERHSKVLTRSSADADKPARRAYRSVKVTKHSTTPYVRYSFLLCNSNFVFNTRFYDIRLQKFCDLENMVRVRQGHWKCHHVIERILTFYSKYGSISCRF